MKVNFNLKDKNAKESLIVMRLSRNGKRITISTGFRISPKFWSDHTKRPKKTAYFVEAAVIEDTLNRFERTVQELKMDCFRQQIELTNKQFKEEVLTRMNGGSNINAPDLMTLIDQVIDRKQNIERLKKGSIKNYLTIKMHLANYIPSSIELSDLDSKFYENFVEYLISLGLADNYIHKLITTLRVVLNFAEKEGIPPKEPISIRNLQIRARTRDSVFLNESELDLLYHLKLDRTKQSRLNKARDLFLLGSYTGLRHSDLNKIKQKNIIQQDGKHILTVNTQKTDKQVRIPLKAKALEIIHKYGRNGPRVISNQKMNAYIKEVCKLAGIDQITEIRKYQDGKTRVEEHPKYKLVQTHTARRSFATNAFFSKVPVPLIMNITGHSKESDLMNYIVASNMVKTMAAAEYSFFD